MLEHGALVVCILKGQQTLVLRHEWVIIYLQEGARLREVFVFVTVVVACHSVFFRYVNNSALADQRPAVPPSWIHAKDLASVMSLPLIFKLQICIIQTPICDRHPRVQDLISRYHYHFLYTLQVQQLPPIWASSLVRDKWLWLYSFE